MYKARGSSIPYLFLFVIDVLSRMINRAIESKSLVGMKLGKDCPVLSLSFFADDSIFFPNANKENGMVMKEILQKFCEGFGQLVNLNKSSIIFSKNVSEQKKEEIANEMQMVIAENPRKYLRIPSFWGKSKSAAMGFIKERILQKIQNWKIGRAHV